MKKELLQKIKRLRKALLISCFLNIVLGMVSLFFAYKQENANALKPFHITTRLLTNKILPEENSLGQKLASLKEKNFEDLVLALKDITLIQDGYRERDFALACLVKFHFFNIEKAFSSLSFPKQRRKVIFYDKSLKKNEILLYPDIEEAHFEKALTFAEIEKWPFTSLGLFQKLKEEKIQDPSLLYAFQLTTEFKTMERLFQEVADKVKLTELIDIITSGKWLDFLSKIDMINKADFTLIELRRRFLLDYIHNQSVTAAEVFLKIDMEQAVKKISDKDALTILKILDKRSAISAKYALSMLVSPRSDDIWMEAARRLYQFSYETIPTVLKKKEVLARFVPHLLKNKEIDFSKSTLSSKESELKKKLFSKAPIEPSNERAKPKSASLSLLKAKEKEAPKSRKAYLVQEGDSLWKISRRFGVDINEIKKLNHLESDFLKPDTLISLP
ncbi:LysM peptidoglycan-binding domain-containing protein [Criblamydia sequanensis]|uniref:Secreted protein n=1 Tax=Candidatus Criblamydia sequanensis CRIB-18 TaxID=1437425 RepID=A0A090D0A6_9BACT|nr:LysM peptidoglycan-binding domain-containing protein [Criblamydia sequanensis]CDR34716.1 putative secreted protein [Criblamydia sequanensis CRIB-18]